MLTIVNYVLIYDRLTQHTFNILILLRLQVSTYMKSSSGLSQNIKHKLHCWCAHGIPVLQVQDERQIRVQNRHMFNP
jgi:hypothetical protein